MQDITLFLVGLLVGAMNAIAGGGMLLGFPVLLSVGTPALVANATSYIVVLPGLVTSTWSYRKYFRRIPRSYALLLVPAVVGAAIGAVLLRHTSIHNFERLVPILIIFAVALFAFQPLLYQQLHRYLQAPKYLRNTWQPIVTISLAMLPLAIYGGYFGAGFGFIMLAFLGFTKLHNHIHRMTALKNVMALTISATALICLHGSHLIDWRHGLVMAAGSLFGGYFGAAGSQKVSSSALRIFVVIIGICTAAYLVIRTY